MLVKRKCQAIAEGGARCDAWPVRGRTFCYWHDPECAEDAKEARRLGGLRREGTIEGAYELEDLSTIRGLLRVLTVATVDLLSLENSVQRNRALLGCVVAGARLLEVGEMAERLQAIESVLGPRLQEGKGR